MSDIFPFDQVRSNMYKQSQEQPNVKGDWSLKVLIG